MDVAPLMIRLLPVVRSRILLELSFCSAKVLLDPQKYHGLEYVALVHVLVYFAPMFHETQGCLAALATSAT